MNFSKKLLVGFAFGFVLMLTSISAFAQDGRINAHHHFGGDALYCNDADGCELLNMNGESLWKVAQSAIDEAMTTACETRQAQMIEAGAGTYGPATLEIACYEGLEPALTLIGMDEWGKTNAMQFGPDYQPVNQPTLPNRCAIDLGAFGFSSYDGIHVSVGYDIWFSGDDGGIFDEDSSFLYWSSTREGLPNCRNYVK